MLENLQDKRETQKPKFHLRQLVRTADIRRVFSKGVSTNWSYKLYTKTEVIHDTIPSYQLGYLPVRFNQKLTLSTKLTLDENNKDMNELNLFQFCNK